MSIFGGELPAGLDEDNEIRDAVKRLYLDGLSEARKILTHGSPAIRLQLIRSLLTSAAKTLNKPSDGDDNGELRQKMDELYSSVNKAIGTEQ